LQLPHQQRRPQQPPSDRLEGALIQRIVILAVAYVAVVLQFVVVEVDSMTDQEKIWAWCDRREAESNAPHGLITYRTKPLGELTGVWFAGVRRFAQIQTPHESYVEAKWLMVEGERDWIDDRGGDTPESAIAALAKALNL